MGLTERGRWLWILSKFITLCSFSPEALGFLACEMGLQCLPCANSGTLEDKAQLAASHTHTGDEAPTALAALSPPRHSPLTVLLIWHLQVLRDKQCHLCEKHGKSQECGELAGRPLFREYDLWATPSSQETLAKPGTWTQVDGSLGRIWSACL